MLALSQSISRLSTNQFPSEGFRGKKHRAGLIFYQTGNFPKALWHLKRGMAAPDANLGEFEGVDFKAILYDYRRRARGE